VFQGGSAGSWNFDGFVTSENTWIYWDVTNERLTFENTPEVDPYTDVSPARLINANQWIDKSIKRYEQYRIQFDYEIHNADLRIYYINGDGFGFDITNLGVIDATNNPTTTYDTNVVNGVITGSYDEIHTIDDNWTVGTPGGDGGNTTYFLPPLRDTFVIRKGDSGNLLNGWIDNVSMTRVFDLSGNRQKTLTFSEDVNGWTSFKSFVPESGVSLSKKYFTMKEGGLWQHYVPMVDGETEYEDNGSFIKYTAEEANNYNTFYKIYNPEAGIYQNLADPSIMQVVLNADPSTVKTFNTLNYEGSQAYIVRPTNAENITPNNVVAWLGQGSVDGYINGWECTEVKTDMDIGSVKEFIKKEGKWFNYIKGKTVNLNSLPDTSRFSVQGIGVASSVISITQ
jgi:hypothetical protein